MGEKGLNHRCVCVHLVNLVHSKKNQIHFQCYFIESFQHNCCYWPFLLAFFFQFNSYSSIWLMVIPESNTIQ